MPLQESEKGAGMNSGNLEDTPSAICEEPVISPPGNMDIPLADDLKIPVDIASSSGENVQGSISDKDEEDLGQGTLSNSDKSVGTMSSLSSDMAQLQDGNTVQIENPQMTSIHEKFLDQTEKKELNSDVTNSSLQKNVEKIETSMVRKFQSEDFSLGETESESFADTSRISGSDSLSASIKPLKIKRKSKKVKTLKVARDGKDSDSSVSSKKKGGSRKILVKCKFSAEGLKYIEDCLRGHIFSGWVDERKWIENLGSYRDIVEVDKWEVELNKQLNVIIRKVPGVQEGTKWINITPPSATEPSYCLWVLLDEAPMPGHYWFVVTGVGVQSLFGLKISLRIIRSIHPQDFEEARVRTDRKKQLTSGEPGMEIETLRQQFNDWWDQAKQLNFALVWSAVTATLTLSNIQEAIRFLVILIVTLTVGLMTFLRESHHVLLRFIHEAGIFLHNVTPFMQSVISFIEKIIGGFYLIVAMVYRDWMRSSGPAPPPPPRFEMPRQMPLPLTQGRGQIPPPAPPHAGPRVVKYVAPEQWVYKRQNNIPPNN